MCRVAAGLSQRELAELSGVCRETVCRLERGHGLPQWRTAQLLAQVLGKPVSVVFSPTQTNDLIALQLQDLSGRIEAIETVLNI
jgi:DNA-binding XRE family transcriptional regulator